ncbi:MAG: helix-turn-helix domain-containing protein [Actinobacteria bacterium]|nr:helix-turn-helix domain-containing protein [Actinomycetota bacterium]
MSINPLSLTDLLHDHVTLEIECIDRMYLNLYVPQLQYEGGARWYLRTQRGQGVPTSAGMEPLTRAFVAAIEAYATEHALPVLSFQPGQRKDDVVAPYLAKFLAKSAGQTGIYLLGKAQEKTTTFRTHKGHGPRTVGRAPQLYRSTAMVKHYYLYGLDADFGPFFIKFSTYFPFTAKVCLNGHEYLKRQLKRAGIAFEPLDNGLLTCADPARAQALAADLSAERIEAFVRQWLARLPQPFSAAEQAAGYGYRLSILQAEFALTQVLDRPQTGRLFFEQVIREHLDLGRPDQVQLIFNRRIQRNTPSRFRTRVITEGVTPTLYIDYKRTRLKQYHKEGRALRTETTINDATDFQVGKGLGNLPALRAIGFSANRRLLGVQSLSHDPTLGDAGLAQLQQPVVVGTQRAAGLRLAEPRAQALLAALVVFRLLPRGFSSAELRPVLARLLGVTPEQLTSGQMTYHLRRLRLHGLIERRPHQHRYQVTPHGWRMALFCTRAVNRLLRPGLARVLPAAPPNPLQDQLTKLENVLDRWIGQALAPA